MSTRALSAPRCARLLGLAAATLLALSLTAQTPVAADDDTYPSQQQVDRARASAQDAASQASLIKAQLALADQRLEQSSITAAKAVEAWNGARYQLRMARRAAVAAQRQADAAGHDVARLRDSVATATVRSYESGGSLSDIGVLLQGPSTTALLDQLNAYYSVTGALQADLGGYESAQAVASVLQDQADNALAVQQRAAETAAQAKQAAEAAMQSAQSAVSAIAAEKDQLIARLAALQHISVRLVQQRQDALEQQAAEQAALQARRQAAQQAAEDAADKQQNHASNRPHSQPQPQPQPQPQSQPQPQPQPIPAPAPAPVPAPNPPPQQQGASAAIAFAKAQLGEPYVWGAAGPDAWDCSGLTMGAWEAAGVSLPHWSVAQYYATTPISSSELRAGDLLFWSDNGSPSSIYHVAMYLGGGMIIQAPRPGRGVEIVSMYYWIPPDLFTRV